MQTKENTSGYLEIKKKLATDLFDKGITVYALADEDSYTIFMEADTDKTSAEDIQKILMEENIILLQQPREGMFATQHTLSRGYYCDIADRLLTAKVVWKNHGRTLYCPYCDKKIQYHEASDYGKGETHPCEHCGNTILWTPMWELNDLRD